MSDPIPKDPLLIVSADKLPHLGEVFDLRDPDECIDAYDAVKKLLAVVYFWQGQVKQALVDQLEGGRGHPLKALTVVPDGKSNTRRVVGKRRRVKMVFPGTSFTKSEVTRLWNKYPEFRDRYLVIKEVGVNRGEVKKIKDAGGNPDLMDFRDALKDAEYELMSMPTITVED